jgi:YgiT-type zinc finger domain-containing protein
MSNKATKNQTMMCDICGNAGVHQRYISRSYGKGKTLLVIERIPMLSCPHCGESYLTAQTLREIERIKRQRGEIAIKRLVAVAVFA